VAMAPAVGPAAAGADPAGGVPAGALTLQPEAKTAPAADIPASVAAFFSQWRRSMSGDWLGDVGVSVGLAGMTQDRSKGPLTKKDTENTKGYFGKPFYHVGHVDHVVRDCADRTERKCIPSCSSW